MSGRTDTRTETVVIDHELGVWCDHCALPSAVTANLAYAYSSDLQVFARWQASQCMECGLSW